MESLQSRPYVETDAATEMLDALKDVTAALIRTLPRLCGRQKELAQLAIAEAVDAIAKAGGK